MKIAWVIGAGGLLGSALVSALLARGTVLYTPRESFCWGEPEQLDRQLAEAVGRFASEANRFDCWEIYWAAGIGTMGAGSAALLSETRILAGFLALLQAESRLLGADRYGVMAYASSAGAIYAECMDYVITEQSAVTPTTPYALAKLEQEQLLADFVTRTPAVRLVIARISTLYGPGQAHGKAQGLLAHIARSIVRNRPVQIYVPFDTIRDYISSADAAIAMICAVRDGVVLPRIRVKIVASEQAVTIAEIIATFKRLSRRHLRIVTSASRLSALYTRRLRFRSVLPTAEPDIPAKRLAVGLAELLSWEQQSYARGDQGMAGGRGYGERV